MKENVIVGRLIPAGTGAQIARVREIAKRRDDLILQQKQAEAGVPVAPAAPTGDAEVVALPAAE